MCVMVGQGVLTAALLSALLVSRISQSLNEKESGLVASHWCRKQINSTGLYKKSITSSGGHEETV